MTGTPAEVAAARSRTRFASSEVTGSPAGNGSRKWCCRSWMSSAARSGSGRHPATLGVRSPAAGIGYGRILGMAIVYPLWTVERGHSGMQAGAPVDMQHLHGDVTGGVGGEEGHRVG